eukprot:7137425-Ditylum_brightwellii.AAC.1
MSSSSVSSTEKDESNDKGQSNNNRTEVIIDSATIDNEERNIQKSEEDAEKGIQQNEQATVKQDKVPTTL